MKNVYTNFARGKYQRTNSILVFKVSEYSYAYHRVAWKQLGPRNSLIGVWNVKYKNQDEKSII